MSPCLAKEFSFTHNDKAAKITFSLLQEEYKVAEGFP
jgi:hypothetical protein